MQKKNDKETVLRNLVYEKRCNIFASITVLLMKLLGSSHVGLLNFCKLPVLMRTMSEENTVPEIGIARLNFF